MDNIKVGIRVRPLLARELGGGTQWMVANNTISQKNSFLPGYYFDHLFDGTLTTDDIFATLVHPIVESLVEGINGTIFAYGQTSSGKTHTMMGMPEALGVIPLAIQTIFGLIESHASREFIIRVSYMEIYNEMLTDLLNPGNRALKIREDQQHNVMVRGLTEYAVRSAEEIAHWLCTGDKNRSVGETNMNERSSRSHTIFTIVIESRERDEETDDGTVKVSTLNLVDLAGSERASATGGEGIRFKEGTFINKSLLTLGNVISKLAEGVKGHVPFRDSKLTRILQPSLGGNARTCIICTVTPAEVSETHSTLKFASRAQKVTNKPVVNEVLVGEEALLKKLKTYERENEMLRKKLTESDGGLPAEEKQQLAEQLEEKEQQKSDLQARIKSLEDIIVKSSFVNSGSESVRKIRAARRQTVCPGFLARDITSTASGHKIFSELHPLRPSITPKRVTFASSPIVSPAFRTYFSKATFERHLDLISPVPVEDRRRTRILATPSFLPGAGISNCTADSLDEEGEGIDMSEQEVVGSISVASVRATQLTDAQVQTDPKLEADRIEVGAQTEPAAASADTAAQTEPLADRVDVATQTKLVQKGEGMPRRGPSLDHSLCGHRQELVGAQEQLEMLQFEMDEKELEFQTLQDQLQRATRRAEAEQKRVREEEKRSASLQKKIKDFEMASQAQEELLLDLQGRLKKATNKLHQAEETNQDLQRQLASSQAVVEASSSQEELVVSLRSQLEVAEARVEEKTASNLLLEHTVGELREKLRETTSKMEERSREVVVLEERVSSLSDQLEQASAVAEAKISSSLEQEDLIQELRTKLADTTKKLQLTQQLCEEEKQTMGEEMGLLKSQLRSLQQSLQRSSSRLPQPPLTTPSNQPRRSSHEGSEVSEELKEKERVIRTLTAKLEGAERSRREEAGKFQQSYEQKVYEARRAQEKVCLLEEQLETLQQTQEDCQSSELRESLQEKEQLVSLLKDKCTSAEEQAQKQWTEHQEYVSRTERMIRDLQQQVAIAEELQGMERSKREEAERFQQSYEEKVSSVSSLEQKIASLSTQLLEAQKEKVSSVASLKQRIASLSAELQEASAALEERGSQSLEQKVVALSAELQKAQEEKVSSVASLERKVVSLSAELQEASAALEEKGSVLEAQQQEIASLEKELRNAAEGRASSQSSLERKVAALSAELEEALEEKVSSVSSLEQKIASLSAQAQKEKVSSVSSLEQKIASLSAQLLEAQKEKVSSVSSLEQKIASLSAQLLEAQKEKVSSVSSLEQKIASLSAQLLEAQKEKVSSVSSLEQKIASLSAQLLEAQKEKVSSDASLKQKVASLSAQLLEAQKEKHAAVQSLEEKVLNLTSAVEEARASVQERSFATHSLEERTVTLTAQLQEAQVAAEEKSAAVLTLEKEVSALSSALKEARTTAHEANVAGSSQEQVVTQLQTQLDRAVGTLEEQRARVATTEEEAAKYKEMAETFQAEFERFSELYNKTEFERAEMEEKVLDTEEAAEKIREQLEGKEREVQELITQLRQLSEKCHKMDQVIRELNAKLHEKQMRVPTNPAAEQQVQALRKENAELRTKVQALAIRPSSDSSLVNDGSGFVTGVAFYQMRANYSFASRENQQLKAKVQKLREEYQQTVDFLKKESEECKRYRQERNVYRCKYEHLKEKLGVTSTEAAAPSVPVSSQLQSANSSYSQTGLEQQPSPRPPRKSIFSMRPGRDFPMGPARREPHKLGQQQQKAQLKLPAQHELIAKHEVSFAELENLEPEKQTRGLWEDTLIAATGGNTDSEGDPDKCKPQ